MRFDGKTAIVTGGSEGIGYAVAEALVGEGANLVLVARRSDILEQAAGKLGPRVCYVVGDVAEEQTAVRSVGLAVDTYGGLDLLVCNAGVLIPGPVAMQPLEQLDRVLSVNLRGVVSFVHHAAETLAKSGNAAIVIVSSATGKVSLPALGAYGASKAALNYLVPTWAMELAWQGIRVNAVSPGGTYTPQLAAACAAMPRLEQATISTNLVKRLAQPSEIAQPILNLLDESTGGYVTGAIWDIDGGYQRDR